MSDRRLAIYRLRLDWRKVVEGVDFLAQRWPGITQYYIGKVFYFADKEHCLDWGRTISGDRYVAMEHGPVPSRIYEILKLGSGDDDEILDYLSERISISLDGNRIHVYSRGGNSFPSLSNTDTEYLERALEFCRKLTFAELRALSHRELPWAKASEAIENNPPMDLALWFEQAGLDAEAAAEQLAEEARFGVR
jgi:uncharacterized phage-associated protein